jgi:hypothetical protein
MTAAGQVLAHGRDPYLPPWSGSLRRSARELCSPRRWSCRAFHKTKATPGRARPAVIEIVRTPERNSPRPSCTPAAPWPRILTRSQETTKKMLSAMSHNPMIRLPAIITWSVRVLIQVRNLASSARLWPGLIMA